jgi:hypothetical protein
MFTSRSTDKSNQINQIKPNQSNQTKSNQIKPNQIKSNQIKPTIQTTNSMVQNIL